MTEQGRRALLAYGGLAGVFKVARRTLDHLHRFARYLYSNVIQSVRAIAATAAQNRTTAIIAIILQNCKTRNKKLVARLSWYSREKRWVAKITADGITTPLGYFKDEIEAAHAYDTAATKYHGEFASLNFPDDVKPEPVRRSLGEGGTAPPKNTTPNSPP